MPIGDTIESAYAELSERVAAALAGPEASDEAFDVLARAVYAFQRKWNVPYGNFCAGREAARWDDIPAVPLSAFKAGEAPLFCGGPPEAAAAFVTSGTTGDRRGIHYFRSLELYELSIRRAWELLELPQILPVFLTQSPRDAPESSLAHMMGVLDAWLGKLGKPETPNRFLVEADGSLDFDWLERILEAAGSAVLLLCGTALAFHHLLTKAQRRGAPRLPGGSWLLETGGYKGRAIDIAKAEFYARLSERFGVPETRILNEYSMTELSSQFYTTGLGNSHRGPWWAKAVVISPETSREVAEGETGHLQIFDLANAGSVLAIQTRDLAIRRANGAFELIGRDPAALPRGCSRAASAMLSSAAPP